MMRAGYDVVSRPAGGLKIIPAICGDGLVHIFGHIDGVTMQRPACRASGITFGNPTEGHETMCISCQARAEAWAMGGPLGVPGEES